MKFKFLTASISAIALAVTLGLSDKAAAAEKVLRQGLGDEIESFDPGKQETVSAQYVSLDAFEGLTTYGPKGEIVPAAAKGWDLSDDGKTYTFHLRENAKWSNGDPVVAGDFVYAWLRVADPKTESPYAYFLDTVAGFADFRNGKTTDASTIAVKAVDDHTLQVTLANPVPYFPAMMRSPVTFPVHKGTIDKFGDQWTKPGNAVSNGAYMLSEWTPNTSLTLVKNPNYWDAANVKIDKVVYYPVQEGSEELKKFRAGELDVTYEVPDDQIAWIKANLKDEYHATPYFGTYYYQFNTSKAPFDNPKLRRALTLAIDRDQIVKKITQGGEIPAYTQVPPGVPGYKAEPADFKKMTQAQRNAEAKKIMKELGYSAEKPLKFEILYNTSERHKAIAVAIQNMWKAIGAEATLKNTEFKVVNQARHDGTFEVNRAGWIGDYVDPSTFLGNYQSDSEQNDPKYKNEKYDTLVKGADGIADPAQRMKQLAEAEAILLKDLPVAPIYTYVQKRMVSKRVQNWHFSILDYHPARFLDIKG